MMVGHGKLTSLAHATAASLVESKLAMMSSTLSLVAIFSL